MQYFRSFNIDFLLVVQLLLLVLDLLSVGALLAES